MLLVVDRFSLMTVTTPHSLHCALLFLSFCCCARCHDGEWLRMMMWWWEMGCLRGWWWRWDVPWMSSTASSRMPWTRLKQNKKSRLEPGDSDSRLTGARGSGLRYFVLNFHESWSWSPSRVWSLWAALRVESESESRVSFMATRVRLESESQTVVNISGVRCQS